MMSNAATKQARRAADRLTGRGREVKLWQRSEDLQHAREVADRYYGLTFTEDGILDLDDSEAGELKALMGRLEYPNVGRGPTYEGRQQAEAFAARIEDLARNVPAQLPEWRREELRDQTLAEAAEVRKLGRMPSERDWQQIRAGTPATELRRSVSGGSTFAPNALTEEEHDVLKQLLEKASGRPGHFAEIDARAKIRALTARALDALTPHRVAMPLDRGVMLPAQLFEDTCPREAIDEYHPDVPDPAKRYLQPHDITTLWALLALMQTGRVPIGANTKVEYEDDGEPVVVTMGPPLGYRAEEVVDQDPVIGGRWTESLHRLSANTHWLDVTQSGGVYRIKLGPRGRKFGLRDGIPAASTTAATIEKK